MIQKSIAARAAGCALALLFASDVGAVDIESLAPQGSTLVIYDTGQGLVSEQRRLTLARGENQIRFLGIPARMDAASASLSASSGGAAIQVLDQRFEYDLTGVRQLLKRYQGQAIAVDDGASVQKGKLLALPQEPDSSLALLDAGGAARVFPDARRLQAVEFPRAAEQAYLTPALVVRATTPQEGLQSLRLNYLVEGLSWEASYEAVRSGAGGMIYLGIRAGLKNLSGARFESARIKLAATEKGGFFDPSAESSVRAGGASPFVMRYAYGRDALSADRTVASAAAMQTYELPSSVTLEDGAQVFVQLAQADKLPVSFFYVYDGVKFDRFQRNRRNDWNYGTESRKTVDTFMQLSNSVANGLGFDLPPGRFRLYQQTEEGAMELVGEDFIPGAAVGGDVNVMLGPARDLKGERERTGYSEIVPLHEYEESFEVRLENGTAEPVEVRVVEHLYRWSEFEIVKSDAEYVLTAPQTIEFRPVLKPGGKRAVHYTVRYRW